MVSIFATPDTVLLSSRGTFALHASLQCDIDEMEHNEWNSYEIPYHAALNGPFVAFQCKCALFRISFGLQKDLRYLRVLDVDTDFLRRSVLDVCERVGSYREVGWNSTLQILDVLFERPR